MSYFQWWHCGGGPEEAERRDFQHGQCRGGGAMRDPNVDPGSRLSNFLVFNSSHFLCVPCNSTFCGGGSLAKLRRQARPRRRGTKGNPNSNTSFQNILLIFFSKTISIYLLCGRPRHPEYLVELVKDVPGKAQTWVCIFSLKGVFLFRRWLTPDAREARIAVHHLNENAPSAPHVQTGLENTNQKLYFWPKIARLNHISQRALRRLESLPGCVVCWA